MTLAEREALGVRDYKKNGLWVTRKGISLTSVRQNIVFGLLGEGFEGVWDNRHLWQFSSPGHCVGVLFGCKLQEPQSQY